MFVLNNLHYLFYISIIKESQLLFNNDIVHNIFYEVGNIFLHLLGNDVIKNTNGENHI